MEEKYSKHADHQLKEIVQLLQEKDVNGKVLTLIANINYVV